MKIFRVKSVLMLRRILNETKKRIGLLLSAVIGVDALGKSVFQKKLLNRPAREVTPVVNRMLAWSIYVILRCFWVKKTKVTVFQGLLPDRNFSA